MYKYRKDLVCQIIDLIMSINVLYSIMIIYNFNTWIWSIASLKIEKELKK